MQTRILIVGRASTISAQLAAIATLGLVPSHTAPSNCVDAQTDGTRHTAEIIQFPVRA